MKKLPLSYKIQLISGIFALFCIPMIFIADATGWFGDELLNQSLVHSLSVLRTFSGGFTASGDIIARRGIHCGCFLTRFLVFFRRDGLDLTGFFGFNSGCRRTGKRLP